MNYCEVYGEEKNFSSQEGLYKAYNFEVLHPKGEIYYFWHAHLHKNKQDLNRDPQGKKGLALQLLYKISSHPNEQFTFRELAKEFSVKEDVIQAKIEQLVKANLIEPTGATLYAHAFADKVLPILINKLYHQLIIEGPSKNVAEAALRDYATMVSSCELQRMNTQAKQNRPNRLKTLTKNIIIILLLLVGTIFICYFKARYDVNSYASRFIKLIPGYHLRYLDFSLCRPIPGYIGVYVFRFDYELNKYVWAITKEGIKIYEYRDL